MLGALFSIASAFSMSVNSITVRRGVARASASQGIYITVSLGVPLFVLAALVTGQLFRMSEITPAAFLVLCVAGVIHFVGGRYSNYRAIRCIGATRAGPLLSLSGPYSLVLAIVLLKEQVTPLMGLAIVLMMIGPAIIVERRPNRDRAAAPLPASSAQAAPPIQGGAPTTDEPAAPARQAEAPFVMRQAEGYLFGAIAALCFGTSPLLVRWALADTGLGIAGGMVSYAAATAVLMLTLFLPGQMAALKGVDRSASRYFFSATITAFLHQMFRYLALSLAPVTVVNPLQRSASIFTLALSWLFNRQLEYFTRRMLVGVVISIVGSLVLALRL